MNVAMRPNVVLASAQQDDADSSDPASTSRQPVHPKAATGLGEQASKPGSNTDNASQPR